MSDPIHTPAEPDDDTSLTQLLRQSADRYHASTGLQQRIQRSIREERARSAPADIAAPAAQARSRAPRAWRWASFSAGLGTAFACGLLLGIAAGLSPTFSALSGADQRALRDELVASHVRATMTTHLTDIASSEHHTVKPWFAGKLDFSPPVIDLADAGFPLQGGRLDYIAKRRVAVLVYSAGPHIAEVFIWPARYAGDELLSIDGFNLAHRNAAGMQIWGVSDMERAQLEHLTALIAERAQASNAEGAHTAP